jgi:MFS transporter, DHA1 family, multidrug resistance protein
LNRPLIILLAAVSALGPMAMQIFVPSLPWIQKYFAVSTAEAQLTLSLSLISIAVSTLAYGPLSDRFDRRPVLLAGFGIFLAGTLLCVFAPTIGTLIAGRIVQAAGGAAGLVLARAIVRDICCSMDAARYIATVSMVMVCAPMVAPAIGGVLQDLFDWRAAFVFSGLVSIVLLVMIKRRLQETNQSPAVFTGVWQMIRVFGTLLGSPAFSGYAFHTAFSSVIFFTFVSAAPYVMANVMARPATEYGLYFILISTGFMFGNFTTARLCLTLGINRMIMIGTLISVTGLLIAYGFIANGCLTPLRLFVSVGIAIIGNGMSMPNTQAAAINAFPNVAGSASGLSGFLQMFLSAVSSQLVASLYDGTAFPMIYLMMAASVLSMISFAAGVRYSSGAMDTNALRRRQARLRRGG